MVKTILVKPRRTESTQLLQGSILNVTYLKAHFLTAALLMKVLLAMVVVGRAANLTALAAAPMKDILKIRSEII